MGKYLVDQFDQPLEPGQLYAVRSLSDPATRQAVFMLVAVIRDVAHFQRAAYQPPKLIADAVNIERFSMANLAAGNCTFTLVDADWREVTTLPEFAQIKETRLVRRRLARIAKEARLLRVRQTRLIEATNKALRGEGKSELEDLTTSWICDSHSHVSMADLMELYRQQLDS